MESLALLATLIVAPAMFGGPIALLLTLWKLSTVSKFRAISIYLLSSSSCLVGVFLIFRDISSGARNIGIIGIVTGLIAIWRLLKR
ncbi:MAG: phosphatase [Actinomycetota bacterium]